MNTQDVKKYLQKLEQELLANKNWQNIELSLEWTKPFSDNAGVYLIRENGKICYVGETGSIKARIKDLRNTQNHVIRRSIGNTKYKNHIGFEKATSTKKFVHAIETKLDKWIQSKLEISVLEVSLGRKEFEEYFIDKYEPIYNNRRKRGSRK